MAKNTTPTIDGQPRAAITLRLDQALVKWARAEGLNPAEILEAALLKRRKRWARKQKRGPAADQSQVR